MVRINIRFSVKSINHAHNMSIHPTPDLVNSGSNFSRVGINLPPLSAFRCYESVFLFYEVLRAMHRYEYRVSGERLKHKQLRSTKPIFMGFCRSIFFTALLIMLTMWLMRMRLIKPYPRLLRSMMGCWRGI